MAPSQSRLLTMTARLERLGEKSMTLVKMRLMRSTLWATVSRV